jgi:hypothetical protein
MKTFTNISITLAITLGLSAGALAGDQKPAAGAPAAPPMKKEMPEAKKAPEPAKKMEMPKPPVELAEMAKTLTGSWKCTGKAAMDPSDPTKMGDATMAMSFKLEPAKWWIKGEVSGKSGGVAFKGTMFTTYEAASKKWYRVMLDTMGGSETAWSTGMKDGKVVWEGEARGMMSGKTRTTEDVTNPKDVKMKSEMSMDGGKTWMTGWEASCKK